MWHQDDDELREGLEDEGLPEPEGDQGDLPLRELREAHQTLLKQSRAPVSGKLDFLRRLKNRLLRHIGKSKGPVESEPTLWVWGDHRPHW